MATKVGCEDEAILQHIDELVQELGPGGFTGQGAFLDIH